MGISARDCKGKAIWYNAESHTYSHVKQNDDDVNFDSEFEFGVWRTLERAKPRFTRVERQLPVILSHATKHFPITYWRVDFALFDPNAEEYKLRQPRLYIEAKGTITDEFKLHLRLLDLTNPVVIDRLIIVCPKKESFKGFTIVQPKQLEELLKRNP